MKRDETKYKIVSVYKVPITPDFAASTSSFVVEKNKSLLQLEFQVVVGNQFLLLRELDDRMRGLDGGVLALALVIALALVLPFEFGLKRIARRRLRLSFCDLRRMM